MRQAQYLSVTSIRQMWRGLLAAILTATMTFAFIPGAHAHTTPDHPNMAMVFHLENSGDSYAAAHSNHATQQADLSSHQAAHNSASEADRKSCCDDTGLCASGFTVAIETARIELLFRANDEWPTNGNPFMDFDPALDIPPPRHS